ncbi:MAG: hypothetical protein AAF846_17285 [Chloroflexota bacterium]
MPVKYQEYSQNTHIIRTQDDDTFEMDIIIHKLHTICRKASDKPSYIMMDFSANYHVPLREFVIELKQFYGAVDSQKLRIALVVQPSLVRVLEAVVKTLVTRESIQYFTNEDRALLWLTIERGKHIA